MNEERFWQIIADACRHDHVAAVDWDPALVDVLVLLPPEAIIEFNHIFDRLAAQAYTIDLWGAAYTINGGASDDGFYYFRCWLIGMGRQVYEAALANPDSLADVVNSEQRAQAEIYAAAHEAWLIVTGKSDRDPYPARNEHAELQGRDWNFDDMDEVRRRFPRLAAIYLDAQA